MRISDWSSDVFSSDLPRIGDEDRIGEILVEEGTDIRRRCECPDHARRAKQDFVSDIVGEMDRTGQLGGIVDGFKFRLLCREADAAGAIVRAGRIEGGRQIRRLELRVVALARHPRPAPRSEEHTSELQSLMRNSYAVFC